MLLILVDVAIGVERLVVGFRFVECGLQCRHYTALLATVHVRIQSTVGTCLALTTVMRELTHILL